MIGLQTSMKKLKDCVNSQLLDAPVGTFLSGGIDSPLVNYFGKMKKKLDSISFYTKNSEHNELLNVEKFNKVIKSKIKKF